MQIITTHNNMDFDGLASLIAAKLLYPEAIAVHPRHMNPNVKAFMSIHKDVFQLTSAQEIDVKKTQSLVVVDTNKWERLDQAFSKLKEREDLDIHIWDHHPDKGNIQGAWRCQDEMGANITLLLREIKNRKISFSPIDATLFLAGIYEDTGNLGFSSAKPEDAYAAGFLLDTKADLHMLNTFLKPAYGEKQKNVLFEMLQQAEVVNLNSYSVSFNQLSFTGHMDRLSLVVNMYREIVNADAAFGIFCIKNKDRCMVIGRSNIDGINIGSIMRSMGGGGHPGAGSAMLKSVNPDAVIEWIRELVEGNQESSVQISDLMSTPVTSVPSDMPMRQVSDILEEKGCTGLPVVEDGKIVGMISRRDFKKVKKQAQLDAPVRAFMVKDVQSIGAKNSPMQAAHLMVKYDIGRLPVLENGNLVGIITRSDAMSYFYDLLPK